MMVFEITYQSIEPIRNCSCGGLGGLGGLGFLKPPILIFILIFFNALYKLKHHYVLGVNLSIVAGYRYWFRRNARARDIPGLWRG